MLNFTNPYFFYGKKQQFKVGLILFWFVFAPCDYIILSICEVLTWIPSGTDVKEQIINKSQMKLLIVSGILSVSDVDVLEIRKTIQSSEVVSKVKCLSAHTSCETHP